MTDDTDTITIRITNEPGEVLGLAGSTDWAIYLAVRLHDDNNTVTISAEECHSSEYNSTPADEYHGRTLCWSTMLSKGGAAVPDVQKLARLGERLRPLLDVIANNSNIDWDGSNMVRRLTSPEAIRARDKIEHIVSEFEWHDDNISVWDATDWFSPNWRSNAEDLGLKLDMTPEQRSEVEAKMVALAKDQDVVLQNVEKAIEYLLDKLEAHPLPTRTRWQ